MHEVAQLLIVLVAYYATFGIMAIGFGMMLGGPDGGASAAGNLFFVRPVLAALAWSRAIVMTMFTVLSANIVSVIGGWIANEIKEVAKDIRWLVTRPRGWVWRQ
jgi:hypothetical protein